LSIDYDEHAPDIAFQSVSPAPNANGWNNENVTVKFDCSNGGPSGLDAQTVSDVVTGEGKGLSGSAACTDGAGNKSQTATHGGIDIDRTGPTANIHVGRAPDHNGWYTSPVNISVTGSDPGGADASGVDFCDNDTNFSTDTDSNGVPVNKNCTDKAGNAGAPDSVTIKYDATAPNTTISSASKPDATTKSTSGKFQYSSSDPGSSFECSLDGSGFDTCPSGGFSYSGLGDGGHLFDVRATDPAGNQDGSPASYGWIVDTTGPVVNITTTLSEPSSDRTPTFMFNTEEGATYTCTFDPDKGGESGSCNNGTFEPTTPLADGKHAFEVVGKDKLGNEGEPKTFGPWTIDGTPGKRVPHADAVAGDSRVVLTWAYPRRIDHVVITRSSGGGTRTFTKPKKHWIDKSAENWHTYTYTLRSKDRAGNLSQRVKLRNVRPTDPLISPRDGVRVKRGHPPLFRWISVAGANQYNLQLWMRHRKVHGHRCCKVLSVFPKSSAYQLPRQWRYGGHTRQLVRKKTYDWYAWPYFRKKNSYGRLIGASFFRVR
jgi:hypothetical protein